LTTNIIKPKAADGRISYNLSNVCLSVRPSVRIEQYRLGSYDICFKVSFGPFPGCEMFEARHLNFDTQVDQPIMVSILFNEY